MAGSRKTADFLIGLLYSAVFIFSSECHVYLKGPQCLSETNKSVDWFIVYKLPVIDEIKDQFYYMDDTNPHWLKSKLTMNQPGHAVYNTLQQIYKNDSKQYGRDEGLLYAIYNDEYPDGRTPVSRGHTKGVLAFNQATGFWLVHSLPKYPNPVSEGYGWPDSGDRNGQTFLCMSLDTEQNLDKVGHQLFYNYPGFYDYNFPASFRQLSPYMKQVLSEKPKHVSNLPWSHEEQLQSLKGTKFLSFAKFTKFDADLYSAWVAPRLTSNLMVETWQLGARYSCSNCTGQFKVLNVAELSFTEDEESFKETKDHSKWAVSYNSTQAWTCVGDINRQPSQHLRAGGTVCLENDAVNKEFLRLIKQYHDCHPYSHCTPPI